MLTLLLKLSFEENLLPADRFISRFSRLTIAGSSF